MALVAAAGASVLIYAAGLIQNDYCDVLEDREHRPERPIPSGRVSSRAAAAAIVVLAIAGVAVAFVASAASGAAALAVLVVMTIYNGGAKRVAVVGPIPMGRLRGLSFLIGAGLLGKAGQAPGRWSCAQSA